MHHRWSIKRRSTWALITVPVLAVASLSIAAASAATDHGRAATSTTERAIPSQFTVAPNKSGNMLDCNGWSPKYRSIIHGFGSHCVDPRTFSDTSMVTHCPGHTGPYVGLGRFADNCHYVGHDEPSVKFISTKPGSAYQMTYYMQLPTDPAAAPTETGSVTDYGELSVAPWFGLPLCDPASFPLTSCTPHSDHNIGTSLSKRSAGSAFMELQFYPPKFAPFQDNVSCNATKWCSALNIDSLEANSKFHLNGNCVEPVNFAFLQTNGIPAGPPSPQKTNELTFTPNAHTLEMSSGDVLKVAITDPLTGPKAGFTATVTDMTTHQTGYMIASAHNGFMNTSFKTCKGSRHTFHAEYNSALQRNQVPWAALQGGVLMEQEIGHTEICHTLSNIDPASGPGDFSDPNTYDTCNGDSEGDTTTAGEGPCVSGICTGAETQGGACPSDSVDSGFACEFADGTCVPAGSRNVTLNGNTVSESSPLNFCEANRFQNGDLDYDGVAYQTTSWPDGTANTPTSIRYAGPFTKGGSTYPQIQFETDIPSSEFLCNPSVGSTCTVPPSGAAFYPFWSLTKMMNVGTLFPSGTCIWNFGNTNVNSGVTLTNFGGDSQYGHSAFPNRISKVQANPETTHAGCHALHQPK